MYLSSKTLGTKLTGEENKAFDEDCCQWLYPEHESNDSLDYTNLAGWSHSDWEQLDIYKFILANFRRYVSVVVAGVRRNNFPLEAYEVLPSLFIDCGYKALASVHGKNLEARGERRNQIMLGSLRANAGTRVVTAVIKEFPFHESLESYHAHPEATESEQTSPQDEGQGFGRSEVSNLFTESSEILVDREILEAEWQVEKKNRLQVELIRGLLTNNQYQHLKSRVCEGNTEEQIALDTGKTVSNARITLKNARKRMYHLLTDEQQEAMAHLVSKKFKGN